MLTRRMKVVLAIAGLVLAMGAVLAVLQITDDGESAAGDDTARQAHPTPTRRPAARILSCPGALGVRASYEESADGFTLVGELESADGGYFTVEVPGADIDLVLAGDSTVQGQYSLGDAVRIEGRLSSGARLEAVNVQPACGLVADVPTATPVATATVAAATVTPTPTRVVPLRPAVPLFVPEEPTEEVTEAPTEVPAPVATEPPPEPTPAPTEPPPTEDPRPTRTTGVEETPPVTE